MPKRHFDRATLRARRRLKDLTGAALGDRIGTTGQVVSKWENGKAFPPYEKLPALARGLESDLDELFPRSGAPDLEDLRCDAGLTKDEAARAIGTSVTPVFKAEKGRQRLNPDLVAGLAAAYGVSEGELLAAQDRTFGLETAVPAVGLAAQPFGSAVDKALANAFPGGSVPDDVELTARVNAEARRQLLGPGVLAELRSGARGVEDVFSSPADVAAFHESLAAVLGVSPMALMGDQTLAQYVLDGLRTLADRDRFALAARGAEAHGVSPDMLAQLFAMIRRDESAGRGNA